MRPNHTEQTLAQRIKLRLDKLGKSERGASLQAGLSDSFLRNIRQNKSSSPRIDTLEKIAEVLDTTSGWLVSGEGEEDVSLPKENKAAAFPISSFSADKQAELPPAQPKAAPIAAKNAALTKQKQAKRSFASHRQTASYKESAAYGRQTYDGFNEDNEESYAPLSASPYPAYDLFQEEEAVADTVPNALVGKKFALSERHLPVYGQAVGGIDGEFPINGSTLYSVLCPPQLSEISGAYAVSISGDSMYPRYEDGEIAFVDPTRRVKKGDYVIAQIMAEEGAPPLAYVKKFIRHNAGGLVLEQFYPAKELHFPHERVVSVHYIALAGTAPA